MKFQAVLNCASPRDHYMVDAVVLWCIDRRFRGAYRALTDYLHISADRVKLAGGTKSLSDSATQEDRNVAVKNLGAAVTLHAARKILLTAHTDCGAYGGLAYFGNDTEAERAHLANELWASAAYVGGIFKLPVECYFVDFEGIHRLEEQQELTRP